jgi:hypothetical protein
MQADGGGESHLDRRDYTLKRSERVNRERKIECSHVAANAATELRRPVSLTSRVARFAAPLSVLSPFS